MRILKDLDAPIADRDVLIVEDIIDSGLTLHYLLRNLQARSPKSIEVCALLTKPERRRVDLPVRYVGFEIPNWLRDRIRARSPRALSQPLLRRCPAGRPRKAAGSTLVPSRIDPEARIPRTAGQRT